MTTADWQELAYAGRTLEAIKAYRAARGVGLADAKAEVERWLTINIPPSPSYLLCCRVGERLVDHLARYQADTGRPLGYWINILPPDRTAVVGQNTIFAVAMTTDRPLLDLAVEIAMAGVSSRSRREAATEHLAGVRMVWVIETDDPTIHVYTDALSHRSYLPGATLDGGDVLPGFACKVADLFG